MNDYYVYVYIDPRNLEEFYFGKGRGTRKNAHLSDKSDSEKAKRIALIREQGLEPIIRVIARNLSEHDALLIEKTLLWKLGRSLTNIASGHYSDNFRPHNTHHLELSGFDYQRGIYYYNIGEGENRNWNDYTKFGFISAGGGPRWRDAILGFQPGDIFAAYLKQHGFVGVGEIVKRAKPIREVRVRGKPLLNLPLTCNGMDRGVESDDLCEHVALVDWKRAVKRTEAKRWPKKSDIYTTAHVRASLENQPETIQFLEEQFQINLKELII